MLRSVKRLGSGLVQRTTEFFISGMIALRPIEAKWILLEGNCIVKDKIDLERSKVCWLLFNSLSLFVGSLWRQSAV